MTKSSFLKVALVGVLLAGMTESKGGLIAFYSFDDPTNPLKDDSAGLTVPGLGLDLGLPEPESEPTYEAAAGVGGSGAYAFFGAQRLLTAFDISPSVYPALTMGGWVKAADLGAGNRKFIGHDNGGFDRGIGLDVRPAYGYGAFTGQGVLNSEKTPAATNDWAFVAVTYDQASGIVKVYVDENLDTGGPLTVRQTPATAGPGWTQAAIGGLSPAANAEGWVGLIDNVFFMDEVLTDAQVEAIRANGKAGILEGAVADDPELRLSAEPATLTFQKLPETRTLSYTIQNAGSSSLTVSNITVIGPDANHFTVRNAPASLPGGGGSSEFLVDFNTFGQVGAFNAQIVIASNDESTSTFIIDLNPRVLSPTLLGLYSFDDSTNPLKDDSGANRTLTAPAAPTYVSDGGVVGGAYQFNGSQRLAAPININPATAPSLTMGAWVKTDVLDGFHKIMGHDNGGWDRTLGLDGRGAAGASHYSAFAGRDAYPLSDPPATPDNTAAWSLVAVVYDNPSNTVRTYIDLDVSTTDDPFLSGTTATTMGPGANTVGIGSLSPTGNTETWVGFIDNVFFVSGALDAAQLEQIRLQGKSYFVNFTADPILSLPTAPIFGDLANSNAVTRNIVVSNVGATLPLRISRVVISGADAGLYSVGAVPAEIAPGGSANIAITLSPGSRNGPVDAQVSIYSNNAGSRLATASLSAFVPYATPREALVAFYGFDDELDPLHDDSGNGLDLRTIVGVEPIYDPAGGFVGGAYSFGATRLEAPININPSVYPKLTMGAWVKTGDLEAVNRKFMGHDDGAWDRAMGLDARGTGGLATSHYTAFAGQNLYPITDPPAQPTSTEEWTFMAVVYDQLAARMTTYVDLNATTLDDDLLTVTTNTSLGSGRPTLGIGAISTAGGENWFGPIDNVFVFKTALTGEQVKALRDGGAGAILSNQLRILGVSRAGGNLTLNWGSAAGVTYKVHYVQNLGDTWTEIATVPSAGSTTSYTDNDATRSSRTTGFYQIAK